MSGSAVNQGGVRFEYFPHLDSEKVRWRARMRNHTGMGATANAAATDLVRQVETELATAKAGAASIRESLRTSKAEPKETT